MASFFRFLIGLAALPFCVSLSIAFFRTVALASSQSVEIVSPSALAFFGGLASFLLLWALAPRPVRVYVAGHELTHAIWAIAFGARVSGLKVGLRGGSVDVSKSNVLITLAPYFFPFYAALVALAALVVRFFVDPLPCPWAWLFALGFTWCFHLCFTLNALAQTQPDVQEYGRLFSWVFILVANLALALTAIVCATSVTWDAAWHETCGATVRVHSALGSFALWVWKKCFG